MKYFLIYLLILPITAFADVAQVKLVKGKAYYVLEKSKKKHIIKKGLLIKRNALIVTSKKSFVKLIYKEDRATVVIGPKSKVTLSHADRKKPKIIGLLEGKIRGYVEKNTKYKHGHDHKFYVKTRTAAMGVRGTDFFVTHNSKNQITSNITLSGEVHMHKKSDKEIYESLRAELDNKKKLSFSQDEELEEMSDSLANHRTQKIPVGSYSGSFPSYEKSLKPVRISPKQFKALVNHKEMGTGKRGRILTNNYMAGLSKKKRNMNLVPYPVAQVDEDEDNWDSVKDHPGGVREGGYVDLKTGIYVSPPEDARIDKKTGLHLVPDELGGIDSSTGEYVPPSGVSLDPINGFVASTDKVYGERNVGKAIDRLNNLSGGLSDQVKEMLDVFKEVSRVDLIAIGNYRFTTNVMENYYGEYKELSNVQSMVWDMSGFLGFQLFHNKHFLIYPKFSMSALWYERALPEVKRNNSYEGMIGWETHWKHGLLGRKARLIADVELRTKYMNYRKRDLFDFYTEDADLKITERFKISRRNTTDLYYQIRSYQGYEDRNHGNIHNVGLRHQVYLGKHFDLLGGYEFGQRREKLTQDHYKIWNAYAQGIFKDMWFQTDLTIGYTYQWHESRLKIPFSSAKFYKIDLLLNKRLGNFWKLNGLYQFSRNQAKSANQPRSFIQQSWGGGITMVF